MDEEYDEEYDEEEDEEDYDSCDAYRTDNLHAAESFDDGEICGIADTQVKRAQTFPAQSASQRQYDRMVRREIRRRGLTWSPPTRSS